MPWKNVGVPCISDPLEKWQGVLTTDTLVPPLAVNYIVLAVAREVRRSPCFEQQLVFYMFFSMFTIMGRR